MKRGACAKSRHAAYTSSAGRATVMEAFTLTPGSFSAATTAREGRASAVSAPMAS